jgi:DNA polymerase-2
MKGFIVYPTYRVIDGKAFVYLYGRLENGESFLTINSFRPYFFIRKSDRKKIPNTVQSEKYGIITYDTEDSEFINFSGQRLVKIISDIPGTIPEIREAFKKLDVQSYEADIRFTYRFLIDNGIRGSMEITGQHKKGDRIDRVYEEPKLKPSDFFPKLRTLSIDIETDMNAKEIFCISMYTEGYNEVYIVSEKTLKNAKSFPDERSMLEAFSQKVLELDPDIITGWNLIDFDLNVLEKRFKHHKLDFVLGRENEPSRVRLNQSFFKDSTVDIIGRIALDGIMLLRISFIRFEDYKLNTAAHEILGEEKEKVFTDQNKGKEIERLFREEPQKLVNYNLTDSRLVYDILQKKKLIDLTVKRSMLTGMQLDRVKASIASLDNLYISEARKLGYICRTSDFSESEERIKGGFVKDSQPGIYDFINVLDFKSLYPSIMRTFNIDPLAHEWAKDEKEVIIAPNKAKFSKKEGIMPSIIQNLWEQRDLAKKNKDAEASFAIKITMNSFFGVLANPMCRFYSLDVANAITSYGRFIVKKTSDLVEESGYKVIYGDTDSIFVESKAKDEAEAKKIGKKIAQDVNTFWAEYVKENTGGRGFLELQFEKTFVRFLLPYIRGATTGAKKRYAGIVMVYGKEEIKFTGLEFVRRDWTPISKKFQLEILDRIFHKKEIGEYVKEFITDLKAGKMDELLVYKKAIRKDLIKYTKTTPPHVKAARKLSPDELQSSIIAYVMTQNGPEPIQKLTSKIDYDHYIEKQLKPIADSVLVFFKLNFDDLMKGSTQRSLFSF